MYVNHMHFCVVSVLLSSVFLGFFLVNFFGYLTVGGFSYDTNPSLQRIISL